ncbi:MAG: glycine oxidase [Pseudohongiellaceae bacterium]|jgi:glycine oxidase
MSKLKIAIAGGGLLGRLIAWRLLKAGHRVQLFEKDSLQHCRAAAATAAGMVSPLAELADSEPLIYDMGMQSLNLWPQWLKQLNSPSALWQQQGSLVIAHPQDHAELQQFKRNLEFHNAPHEDYNTLNRESLQQFEPALRHFQQGLLLKTEAHIDNQKLLPLLLQEIVQLGGVCHEACPVHEITDTHITTLQGRHQADWHIDCRGVGAKPAIKNLRGVRGEVLWVSTREVTLQRPIRLLHPRYKLYIVPKPKQQFVIGATEIESEDLSPISLQSNLELTSALYSLNPAFAEARIINSDVNLRPAMMDNRPYLSFKPSHICANGLYRHGYLLAPSIVNKIINYIEGRNDNLSFATQ